MHTRATPHLMRHIVAMGILPSAPTPVASLGACACACDLYNCSNKIVPLISSL